jgi:hypothetical protein
MATNFPNSVDALTNPVSNDSLNSPSHSAQHANANDAIEAIESYVLGTTGTAWISYVPSIANVNRGTGFSEDYVYFRVGKLVVVRIKLKLGTGAGLIGPPIFGLPFTASTQASMGAHGLAQINDFGTAVFYGAVEFVSTTTCQPIVFNAAGTYLGQSQVSGTVPMTWTVNDQINMQFVYEAA